MKSRRQSYFPLSPPTNSNLFNPQSFLLLFVFCSPCKLSAELQPPSPLFGDSLWLIRLLQMMLNGFFLILCTNSPTRGPTRLHWLLYSLHRARGIEYLAERGSPCFARSWCLAGLGYRSGFETWRHGSRSKASEISLSIYVSMYVHVYIHM